ncbi:MAG: universal stress protein [Acetobacteraceae bacterium]
MPRPRRPGAGPARDGRLGHARLREAVFGGVTRRVLTQADIPVLMMH